MEQGLLTDLYYDEILKVINEIRATERENILKAARMIADQVKQDKLVYVFGPGGHSNLAAMEVFFRAGGLMHISAILNQETMLSSGALKSMQTERLPGYGKIVVEDYGIGEGDLLWIVNAYGIRYYRRGPDRQSARRQGHRRQQPRARRNLPARSSRPSSQQKESARCCGLQHRLQGQAGRRYAGNFGL